MGFHSNQTPDPGGRVTEMLLLGVSTQTPGLAMKGRPEGTHFSEGNGVFKKEHL